MLITPPPGQVNLLRPSPLLRGLLSANMFVDLPIEPKQTFLHPWCNEKSMILVAGDRGVGKTWWVLSVLHAVASGGEFGPWKCPEPVPCLYLDGEMSQQDVIGRLQHLGVSRGNGLNNLFIFNEDYAHSMNLPPASLLDENWRENMRDVLKTMGIKLWAIDNLASLTPGADENSKQEWDPINRWLLSLRFEGITTIIVHHTGKSGKQRGTSAREDNLDVSIRLSVPSRYETLDGASFIASFVKHRVNASDLPLLEDVSFKMQTTANNRIVWHWQAAANETLRDVLRYIEEAHTGKEIAEIMNITPGRVSQLKGKAIRKGFLTKEGELTDRGRQYLFPH